MLLWPRLERAKIRKVADNPTRMAEIIERRTSQPFDVILAMLTKQTVQMGSATEETPIFEPGRGENSRVALRIVRSEEGEPIQVQDLLPA
jgi:hypothetical protein